VPRLRDDSSSVGRKATDPVDGVVCREVDILELNLVVVVDIETKELSTNESVRKPHVLRPHVR
jgi:hypothetical protein